ncbi:uncharacterized protein LOC131693506 [Topomyia yanbarensis]|uniref:uncharacterized protein LOC131693506 n=1 Tax=Topomyia yanbarensis TaxID=2498891 RepID=UPI00273C044B|nr:uncharacterized protein LOC131693506 [Topomyia yanbarensis]
MYKLLSVVVVIAIVIPTLTLAVTPFRSCPNGAPTPETFEVDGCTALPCTITRGQPMRAVGRNLVSLVSTSTVEAYIDFFLGGLDLGIPTPPEIVDACANGIDFCPLVQDESFDYTFFKEDIQMDVSGITVLIRVGLRDGDVQIGCIEFDGTIV